MKNLLSVFLFLSIFSFSCEKVETQSDSIQAEITAIENGLLPPFVEKGDSSIKMNIYDRMDH